MLLTADACHRQHNTDNKSECNGSVNGLSHGIVFFFAEPTGNYDAGPHGYTVEKADHHKNQTARRADGRQRIVAYVIADTPCVECIV